METYTQGEIQDIFRRGVDKARAGELEQAYVLLQKILKVQPEHEEALIWIAAVSNDPQESVECLEKVLKVNPENKRALDGLSWARKRLEEARAKQYKSFIPEETTKTDSEEKQEQPIAKEASPVEPDTEKSETKPEGGTYKLNRSANIDARTQKNETNSFRKGQRFARKSSKRGKKVLQAAEVSNLDSPLLKAAAPRVSFKVSDKLERESMLAYQPASMVTGKAVRLKVPLAIFGSALILAMACFVATPVAPVFGTVAIALAIAGVFLFTRVNF